MTVALVLALLAAPAHAASCCGGTSAAVPTRPAGCDRWVLGLGVAGETALGRWNAAGESVPTSVSETFLTATLGGGYRFGTWGGAVGEVPVQVNWKRTAADARTGGGLADIRLGMFFDPFEEPATGFLPVPILNVGVRLPTGLAWTESTDPLLADVTGLADAAVTAALSVERAVGRVPYSLGAALEWPIADPVIAPPILAFSGAVGFSVDGRWVILGTARHTLTPDDAAGPARTSGGLRLMRNEPSQWRAWVAVESDIPAPGLGRENLQAVRGSVGFLFVR